MSFFGGAVLLFLAAGFGIFTSDLAGLIEPDQQIEGCLLAVPIISLQAGWDAKVHGTATENPFAELYTSEQTRAFGTPRIGLQQKDCFVGQSIPGACIPRPAQASRISSDNIAPHPRWRNCPINCGVEALSRAVRGGEARSNRGNQGENVWQQGQKGRISMPLTQIVLALIVVGVLLWLVNRFIPMQGSIKSILNGVVVIAVVLWLLNVFGLFHSLPRIHVGT